MVARHVSSGDTTSIQVQLPAMIGRQGVPMCISLLDARAHRIDAPIRIGRGEGCELVVNDSVVSRTHVLVEPLADGVVITDQHSRNGTFVDGRRITQVEIRGDAIVRVGDSVIRIVTRSDEHVAASSGPLVGGSSLVAVRRTLGLVAPTTLPVLVLGETGTGKEVVARAIHDASGRRGPFVAVNCAALPDHLIESELFGHARGAFTGAGAARRGLFAEAAEGTLFLYEIGVLAVDILAKLLRALETRSVRPVGCDRESAVDVRVVSATNRDLRASADDGTFRPDLLARLAGVELRLPPLRERVEDLPALIEFLSVRARASGTEVTANALEALALYDWPHNVRELDHVLRAATLVDARTIDLESLPERIQAVWRERRGAPVDQREEMVREAPLFGQRTEIEAALRAHAGNVRETARVLGISRGHLYRLLKLWELDPAAFRRTRAGTGPALATMQRKSP